MSFLGIDLGTSGLRLLLIDEAGDVLATAERGYVTQRPHDGWSEQSPSDWVAALESAVAEVREEYPAFSELRGIGVSGHMHGAVVLNTSGDVLRPCIMWNDTRAHGEAEALDKVDGVRDLSGNIVFAGFTAPKLVWLAMHEPEIFKQVETVMLPAGYMNFALTGERVADMSDSAGTSWLDVAGRDWSESLLSASGMARSQMPKLVEGAQHAGVLRADIAARWGVGPDVVVAGGAGDNAAAACGIGALDDGVGFVSLGTSGVVLCARDRCAPSPATAVHTFCHAVPDHWYQMGVMLSATDSLNWWGRITGRSPAELSGALGTSLRAPAAAHFLPYLAGERTPHNDTSLRGSFDGLSHDTTQEDMTQAVLEGVAFGLRDSLEALRSVGAAPQRLFAIGGGAKSEYWVSLIATVFNLPLDLPAGGEFGAALGAARLGICAATGADVSVVMTPPKVDMTVMPDARMVDAYEAAYQTFKTRGPN
ncbi:xylulokinase [Octadecabacter sp. 1_MG-2023]|uniref:xylulokinase n=1 Tax=unclassified Octadecabacter TaxID=196158 RepID=UPI001C0994DE|nr:MULTISPECIES: xylulokinase [unclassified Octadecabacter]MBU2992420.1 xylulokinase [Octadecabacter sp. B2R22]MDO6734823.1 xylulokinase [Octadecabacter sp. 1_MG-2023]